MFQFQPYDPARPRMVTSFKGNQKLIFEGYRYNIHHIVPAKGVKTWRCVCAKKLTSARSWCKGRAETWDNDSQGISKGEHNHLAEHEVAELEYFKSQLIMAAIAQPVAPLNDLIDEAVGHMSAGVNFGSRESLKKSLTVARKSAENGVFKLKCYKNNGGLGGSAASGGSADINGGGGDSPLTGTPPPPSHTPHHPTIPMHHHMMAAAAAAVASAGSQHSTPASSSSSLPPTKRKEKRKKDSGIDVSDFGGFDFGEAQMQSFLSLARQCQQQHQQKQQENGGRDGGGSSGASSFLFSDAGRQNGSHYSSLLADSGMDPSSANSILLSAAAAALASGGSHNGSPLLGTSVPSSHQSGDGRGTTSCSSTTTTSSDLMDTSGLEMDLSSFAGPLAKMMKWDSGVGSKSSGVSRNNGHRGHHHAGLAARSGVAVKTEPACCESGNSSARSTPLSSIHAASNSQRGSSFQMQKKTARINNIFNKLSNKAAAAAGCTSETDSSENLPCQTDLRTAKPAVGGKNRQHQVVECAGEAEAKKSYVSVQTQTSDDLLTAASLIHLMTATEDGGDRSSKGGGGIRLSKCLSSQADCNCRVIRVCCCSEETNCWRSRRHSQQRRLAGGEGGSVEPHRHHAGVKRMRRYSGD